MILWKSPPIRDGEDPKEKTRRELIDLLVDLTTHDPKAPAGLKVSLMIATNARDFEKKLLAAVKPIVLGLDPDCSNAEVEKAREFLEYLQLMSAGFDTFMAAFNSK